MKVLIGGTFFLAVEVLRYSLDATVSVIKPFRQLLKELPVGETACHDMNFNLSPSNINCSLVELAHLAT